MFVRKRCYVLEPLQPGPAAVRPFSCSEASDKKPGQNATQNARGRHAFNAIIIFASCNKCFLWSILCIRLADIGSFVDGDDFFVHPTSVTQCAFSQENWHEMSVSTRLFTFVGGSIGLWRIVRTDTLVGDPLVEAERLDVMSGSDASSAPKARWTLRGITSNDRYVVREEKSQLLAKQQGLGRPEATCAALIPLRKNAAWWALTQDDRRSILEEQSRHIKIGLQYLPAVARRLHHCRDLSEHEPFDFLTWFEYAPAHEAEFNTLVAALRLSTEWTYVDREVDIRLKRE